MSREEREITELEKEIIRLKQKHLKEKCEWFRERDELKEIIHEIKSCLYYEKIPDESDGESTSFYDNEI